MKFFGLLLTLLTINYGHCAQFDDKIEINEPGLIPEGIEYDRLSNKFIIGSLGGGPISRVDENGNTIPWIILNGKASVGIHLAKSRRVLFVPEANPWPALFASDYSAVSAFDADHGTLLYRTIVSQNSLPGLLNDCASNWKGTVVHCTDSQTGDVVTVRKRFVFINKFLSFFLSINFITFRCLIMERMLQEQMFTRQTCLVLAFSMGSNILIIQIVLTY